MKDQNPRKSKLWEDFEKLIAHFEEFLSPQGAVVTHNDKIPDIDTGHPRQVDCTIRYRIGSTDLLIAIECRKRSSRQDVRWIEELAGKRRSIGADVIVGVSSTGFSHTSLTKAKLNGVQLRRIDTIKAENFFKNLTWHLTFEHYEVKKFDMVMGGEISNEALNFLDIQFNLQKHTPKKDLRIIKHEQIINLLTPTEVFELALKNLKINGELIRKIGVGSDSRSVEATFKFDFGQKWSIPYKSEKIRIYTMIVTFELHRNDAELTPNSNSVTYLTDDGKTLAAIQPYVIEGGNDFFRDVTVSIDPKNNGIYIEANLHDGSKLASSDIQNSYISNSILNVEIQNGNI